MLTLERLRCKYLTCPRQEILYIWGFISLVDQEICNVIGMSMKGARPNCSENCICTFLNSEARAMTSSCLALGGLSISVLQSGKNHNIKYREKTENNL